MITEEGSFYTFNVKYANEPILMSVDMKDFIHDGDTVSHPNNALEVYLKELGNESPMMVHLIICVLGLLFECINVQRYLPVEQGIN